MSTVKIPYAIVAAVRHGLRESLPFHLQPEVTVRSDRTDVSIALPDESRRIFEIRIVERDRWVKRGKDGDE